MDTVTINMGSMATLLSSMLAFFAAYWCIRKVLKFINRAK